MFPGIWYNLPIYRQILKAALFSFYCCICRPGVELELHLRPTPQPQQTLYLSRICNLCQSLWQHQILNLLSKARAWIHIFTEAKWGPEPIEPQWELLKNYFKKIFVFLFRTAPAPYRHSQARGCSCRPTSQPQQRWIWATSATCTTAWGNP